MLGQLPVFTDTTTHRCSFTVAAALAPGAQAARVDTAFLAAEECGILDLQKQQLTDSEANDFIVSRCWTGKTTRTFNNLLTRTWTQSELEPLEALLQKVLVEDFQLAAEQQGPLDLALNPVGQIGGMSKTRKPAAEILTDMVTDAIEVLKDLDVNLRIG